MKGKRAVFLAATAVFAVSLFAFTGCEWFSPVTNNTAKSVSDTLGYTAGAGAFLTSREDSSHSDYYMQYQEAIANRELDSSVTFLEFLKAMHDDSASLANSLCASVAIVSRFQSNNASAGSGVIYSLENRADGVLAYIVTNYHIVYRNGESGGNKIGTDFYVYLYGDQYDVKNPESSSLKATYLGGAMDCDIAVLTLKIPASRASSVRSVGEDVGVRNSDHATAGEKVYAIGNPLGYGISVVSGVVAVEAEYVGMPRLDNPAEEHEMLEMRLDAPVNHGNSGGGVFDANGKLVGIVNGGLNDTVQGTDIAVGGFGYAIPANRALSVAQSIIDNYKDGGTGAATYGYFATVKTTESYGKYNDKTLSVDIIEKVQITQRHASSPFGQDIVGKIIKDITVTNSSGATTVPKMNIVRRHQVETLFYNVRLGDTVLITFDDDEGSTVQAVYDQRTCFGV